MVSLPERSVTWTKVSLKEAKIRATPKTWELSLTAKGLLLVQVHKEHKKRYKMRLDWNDIIDMVITYDIKPAGTLCFMNVQ